MCFSLVGERLKTDELSLHFVALHPAPHMSEPYVIEHVCTSVEPPRSVLQVVYLKRGFETDFNSLL